MSPHMRIFFPRLHRLTVPLATALALVFVLWLTLSSVSAQGAGDVCFAEYTGDNVTDFSSADSQAVRDAVAAANPGDTVKIAGVCAGTVTMDGTTQLVIINKVLTLAGGYTTTNWLTSSAAQTTTLDALQNGRVISATAVLTVQYLTIQNGRTTDMEIAGYGAGIYTSQAITLNQVIFWNNVTTGKATFGGGAYANGMASITGSDFLSNTTVAGGGGAFVNSTANISGTSFLNNTVAGDGGGAYVNGMAGITGTAFLSNTAGFIGGGAYVNETASISGTSFRSNTAGSEGGGAYFRQAASIGNSSFISNTAAGDGGGAIVGGTANITGSSFRSNTASDAGGIAVGDAANVTGSSFISNTAKSSSGGALIRGAANIIGSSFISNTARTNGGGALVTGGAGISGTSFISNTAESGGGALIVGITDQATQVVNTLFMNNRATNTQGNALYLFGIRGDARLSLLHMTVASAVAPNGPAIFVNNGTVTITNTIVSNHAIAIERVDGTVNEDFNLFDTVTTPFSGTVAAGTHSITGTAAFVDPANGDFQLSALSDAINAGTDAGITVDYFGEVRPRRGGFDIGFDESPFAAPFALVGRQPLPNALGVSVTTPISAVFDTNLAAASVTSRTFAVQTSFGGLLTGTASVAGNSISITPTRPLFTGEQVQVIATGQIRSSDDAWLRPMQWGFTTGPVKDRCVGNFQAVALNLGAPGIGPVAWGDYDNDGDLDILMAGYDETRALVSVYRNDGAGTFVDSNAALPGISSGTADWVDYDTDGDLDILLTGKTKSDWISRLYRNDGGVFVEAGAADDAFVGLNLSSTAWGDYDNDGDLDVVLSGETGSGNADTRLFRNDEGVFVEVDAGLTQVFRSAAAWGDYDNDGDLDLLLSGLADNSPRITKIYRNDAGVFVDMDAGLPGFANSRAAWGDFDNDGDLDILLSGNEENTALARIFRNDDGFFSNTNAELAGALEGQVDWGDFDNDGDLDALITGTELTPNAFRAVASVYRNDGGSFVDVSLNVAPTGFVSGAWGDYDNDGDLDILVQSVETQGLNLVNPQLTLYRNNDCDQIYLPMVQR